VTNTRHHAQPADSANVARREEPGCGRACPAGSASAAGPAGLARPWRAAREPLD